MQGAFAEQVCSLPTLPASHLFSYTYNTYDRALYSVKYLTTYIHIYIFALRKLQNSDT